MSFHNKMSKNFPSGEVEAKNRKNKSVMKGCPSLDLNQSLEEKDLQSHQFLNSTNSTKLKTPQASEPQHDRCVEELEYGCNFCPRKFSNKQALGGHQNAHKMERVGFKRPRQGQNAYFGYPSHGYNNGTTSLTYQGRKTMKGLHYPQYMENQHGYPGSMFPMPHESVVVQPFKGFGGFSTMPHESRIVQPFSSFCTSPANPNFRSMERKIGPGDGRSTAVARNDEAGPNRQGSDTKTQQQEDNLNLLLKL